MLFFGIVWISVCLGFIVEYVVFEVFYVVGVFGWNVGFIVVYVIIVEFFGCVNLRNDYIILVDFNFWNLFKINRNFVNLFL